MPIIELTKEYERQWEEFIGNNDRASFSHSLMVRPIIKDNYGYQDHYLISLNTTNNLINGALPLFKTNKNKLISLPFFDQAGIIADNQDVIKNFIDYLSSLTKKSNTQYELRQGDKLDLPENCLNSHNVTSIVHLIMDPAELWKKIDKKVRNQVRKAEKYHPDFFIDKQYFQEFYRLYSKTMARHGTPAHKKNFLSDIFNQLPDSSIAAVKYNNKVVAAALIIKFQEKLFIPWAASDYRLKNYNFNDYLYWQILSYACQNKISSVNLGRSQNDSSVLRFKNQWDSVNYQLYYYLISPSTKKIISPQQSKLKYLALIYQHLPYTLTKYLGPSLRKYLP